MDRGLPARSPVTQRDNGHTQARRPTRTVPANGDQVDWPVVCRLYFGSPVRRARSHALGPGDPDRRTALSATSPDTMAWRPGSFLNRRHATANYVPRVGGIMSCPGDTWRLLGRRDGRTGPREDHTRRGSFGGTQLMGGGSVVISPVHVQFSCRLRFAHAWLGYAARTDKGTAATLFSLHIWHSYVLSLYS